MTLNTSLLGVIYHAALVLLYINQYTKFEVPSFTNYKNMIGAHYEKRVTKLRSFFFYGWFVTIGLQNLTILASTVPEISLKASKFKMGHVTQITLL